MKRRRVPAKVQAVKFLRLVLPASLVLFGGALLIFGIIIYRVTHPAPAPESANPSQYLLPSLDVTWTSRDATAIAGWWIPGLKGAPAIVLAPGYGMSRTDALSLAAVLRERGFNLLIYAQRGSGVSPRGSSSLGLREEDDMISALDYLRSRREVNQDKIGIWGVDVAARAALAAAAARPEVRAVAADSAYDAITDFLAERVREEFGFDNELLQFGCRQIFLLYLLVSTASLGKTIPLERLADCSILFIQGENRKQMSAFTAQLQSKIQSRKEITSLSAARVRSMTAEELKTYDGQVSKFFNVSLPRTATRP